MASRGPGRPPIAGVATHEGFLRHRNFRWLKVACAVSLISVGAYMLVDQRPHPGGGTVYGYTMGTIGALLILWLTLLGLRKRAMTTGRWSLKAWTSAHVYLGLALIVIGTLHTGFRFGWNVHTLVYALMMLVIVSGIFGVVAYARIPRALSGNREETSQTQMLENLRSIDRQLDEAAGPLDAGVAALVRRCLAADPLGGGLWARLANRYPDCPNRAARQALGGRDARDRDDPLARVESLLERREAALARVRRHLRLKGLLEVWLYLHVPATFALIAALAAHIASVFLYG